MNNRTIKVIKKDKKGVAANAHRPADLPENESSIQRTTVAATLSNWIAERRANASQEKAVSVNKILEWKTARRPVS